MSKPKPFTEENEVHAWLIAYILEKRVDLGCVAFTSNGLISIDFVTHSRVIFWVLSCLEHCPFCSRKTYLPQVHLVLAL